MTAWLHSVKHLVHVCREKAKDPAWLVGHIEDLVRYRPSLEGYSVEEVLESMLIQTCLASIKVGRHPYPTPCCSLSLMSLCFCILQSR